MALDLILLAISVYVGFKLFNSLGNKDYDDKIQPPKNAAPNNVVQFPEGLKQSAVDVKFEEINEESYEELEKKHGSQIADQIKKIRKIDPTFTEAGFVKGADTAFEIILKAFSEGDKFTLRKLLSKEMYKDFEEEIDKRNKDTKTYENTLVAVLASNIKSIALERKYAKIAVEIVSEQINLIKDKKGDIIEGNPSSVNKISELWTFARNLSSSNPNWELVETSNAK
jgi:predicted lipid-binding transport protein (Tim44 family)